MRVPKRIIDWINLLLGVWLIITPWIVGAAASTTGTTVLVIMGFALVISSAWALYRVEERAPEWWNLGLGVLLFVLPWIFSYTAMVSNAWTSWIVGAVVALLALITMPMTHGIPHHKPPHHA